VERRPLPVCSQPRAEPAHRVTATVFLLVVPVVPVPAEPCSTVREGRAGAARSDHTELARKITAGAGVDLPVHGSGPVEPVGILDGIQLIPASAQAEVGSEARAAIQQQSHNSPLQLLRCSLVRVGEPQVPVNREPTAVA
jgi:hypothetical protein